jgi:iron(III) transport system permease protein
VVLIIPTLLLFLLQRYYVNRRSYISVTGKPSGAQITEKDPFIRWGFNVAAYAICAFVVLLYATIIYGSFSFTWGVDFTPTLRHWSMVVTRGVEAILDTTFLSVMATPFAAVLGMIIAWLVVRKNFSGKEALDFSSNLGGAVPGTILGIGFVLIFNKAQLALAVVIYAVLALFFVLAVGRDARERLIILLLGTAAGILLTRLETVQVYYLLGGLYVLLGLLLFLSRRQLFGPLFSALLGVYVMSTNWAEAISKPIATFSRDIPRGFWSNAVFQFSDHIKVIFNRLPLL